MKSTKNCSRAGPFAIEASRPAITSATNAFQPGIAAIAVVVNGSNAPITCVRIGSFAIGAPESTVRLGSIC